MEADKFVHDIVRDWRKVSMDPADKAICSFAAKLTMNETKTSNNDLDELRKIGFGDKAIHDVIQVTAYFNYITRIADAAGITPDVKKIWGQ